MLSAKYIHINMDKNNSPKLYTLPDTLRRQSSPAAVTIYPVQRVQRPGVRVGVRPAVGGLSCIWHGLCRCLRCAIRLGALVAGVTT